MYTFRCIYIHTFLEPIAQSNIHTFPEPVAQSNVFVDPADFPICVNQTHLIGHCNTLQHTATHCNTLQHTATYCNTLQHTATHCNTLQHTAPPHLIGQQGFWDCVHVYTYKCIYKYILNVDLADFPVCACTQLELTRTDENVILTCFNKELVHTGPRNINTLCTRTYT